MFVYGAKLGVFFQEEWLVLSINSPTITRFRKLFLPADISCNAYHEVFSLLFLFNYLFYGSIWNSYDQHHVHLLLLVMQCLLFVKVVLSFHVSPIWNILIWDLFFLKNCCMIYMLSLWLKVALISLSETTIRLFSLC